MMENKITVREIQEIRDGEASEWKEIEFNITGTDEEDGGYEADMIIQRKVDKKFLKLQVDGWSIESHFDPDLGETFELTEVFKKQKTIDYYE